jgi:hypothetical protein
MIVGDVVPKRPLGASSEGDLSEDYLAVVLKTPPILPIHRRSMPRGNVYLYIGSKNVCSGAKTLTLFHSPMIASSRSGGTQSASNVALPGKRPQPCDCIVVYSLPLDAQRD